MRKPPIRIPTRTAAPHPTPVATPRAARAHGTLTPVAVLFDPEDARVHADLHATYRRLRDEQPVYRDPNGRFVAISRFEDCWDILGDHEEKQKANVRGLGLRKIRSQKTLENTSAVRGMIKKVIHLLEIVE